MLYKFCAVITEQEDGSYIADVPEINSCMTGGNSLEETIEMAKDAAGLCLVVMEDHGDDIPNFLARPDFERRFSNGGNIVVELEVDSDKARAESDACDERSEFVKAMNTIVKCMCDEDAYSAWIEVVPDQADEYDLNDVGCDEELFKEAVELFKDIMFDHMKHGFYIGKKLY